MVKKIVTGLAVLSTVQAMGQSNHADTTAYDADSAVVAKSLKHKKQDLQPIEVRASRASSTAPFAKTEVAGKELQKNNLGQDLPVLLQFTPSVVVNSDAGAGVGYTGIHIRGTDATRINITFNGMPVNDPEEQATYFVDIPDIASSTSSVQIQRGVGTSTNGAGAFGATVSINNLKQLDSAGGSYTLSGGSFNTMKNTLVAGTGLLKNGLQFDVRLSDVRSDGYIQRASTSLQSMQLTAGWKASDKTSFKFLFMPGREKTGQAWNGVPQDSLSTNRRYNELGLKPDGSYYDNQTDNYYQNYYQFFADHQFNKNWLAHGGLFLTRGKGYYEEYKTYQAYADYGLNDIVTAKGDTISQTDMVRRLYLDNYYYGGIFNLYYTKNKTNAVIGGGWSQFENLHYGNLLWAQNGGVGTNYQWYRNDAQKNDLNVFGKIEQSLGKVSLFGDFQYRNVAYFMNGFRDHPALRQVVNYDFFNPKAGFNWAISNEYGKTQRMYASVAVGNREPNRGDYEADPINLPKPERLYDGELGYELDHKNWGIGANLYYMHYNNQLALTGKINSVGEYTQTNVDQSYRAGIELMGAWYPTKWLNLNANATFSQNKVEKFTEYIDNYDSTAQTAVQHSNTDLSFSPSVIGAFTVGLSPFKFKNSGFLNIDISTKYVGKQYLDNTSNENRILKAYSYTNITIRHGFKLKPFRMVTATVGLNNIFGSMFESNGWTYTYISGGQSSTYNAYFPQAGFHFMAGLNLVW